MKSVFQTCRPRPEVLQGDLREEIFAARLRDVIEGRADPVYQNPSLFFENTYPTQGLKILLHEALGRLTGTSPASNAIIRLETAFGGGKTHNLIGLYHAARGHAPGPSFVDDRHIPAPGAVRVAGVVGSDLGQEGIAHPDLTTYTLWGELAYQLAGAEGYALVAASDRDRSAPGTGLLERLIGDDGRRSSSWTRSPATCARPRRSPRPPAAPTWPSRPSPSCFPSWSSPPAGNGSSWC